MYLSNGLKRIYSIVRPKKTNRRLRFATGELYQTIFWIEVGNVPIGDQAIREFMESVKRQMRIPPRYMD